jgi:hypothetical protein
MKNKKNLFLKGKKSIVLGLDNLRFLFQKVS